MEIIPYISRFQEESQRGARPNLSEERFVVTSGGSPVIMIELFSTGFQVYGPQQLSVAEFFNNLRTAVPREKRFSVTRRNTRDRLGPLRGRDRWNEWNEWTPESGVKTLASVSRGSKMVCGLRNGEIKTWSLMTLQSEILSRLRLGSAGSSLRSMTSHFMSVVPEDASYLSLRIPMINIELWADVGKTTNPRSGVAYDARLNTSFWRRTRQEYSLLVATNIIRRLLDRLLNYPEIEDVINFVKNPQLGITSERIDNV